MFDDALKLFRAAEAKGDPRAALLGYIDSYLSHAHLDDREQGCPMPALAGDVARSASEARDRFAAGVAALTKRASAAVAALGVEQPEVQASAILSQMVGAIVLARAVVGPASDTILENARAALISRHELENAA